ncbi:Nicotinamidase-related amidase [Burkholderiales bacterium 8X]|nr:Nicotinamidase-related amidase [Burkholderiales bacterium 8X]
MPERQPPKAAAPAHQPTPKVEDAALAPDTAAAKTVLLVIDMISCWDFPDAEKLLPGAVAVAPRIEALKARCRKSGIPVIYANDARGRWRSDFPSLVELAVGCGGPGASIARQLMPEPDDYFVLKPKHSAFFATPLELLLAHLEADRLILTGVASDQCVLSTAFDARMRDLEVMVPRDCVASQSKARNDAVLRQLEGALKLSTTPAARLKLTERPKKKETQ